ncbi:phosphoglucosamine mutase [Mycoplasmatota bacterium zrk1]
MKKYFGTDGIRGIANDFLSPELAFKLGKVLGAKLRDEEESNKPYVYVGKDTRISSPLLEYSLISGFLSSGVDVKRLHLIPTPCVAYLTASTEASMGVMISASHNPYYDNGIKIFDSNGMKLPDEEELIIESMIDNVIDLPTITKDNVGIVLNRHESMYQYIESLFFSVKNRFDSLRIGLDCANGSTSVIAKRLFVRLGAEVFVINDEPNGTNINDNCGSTHLAQIKNLVLSKGLDFGFAFDGDGDRVLAIDELGNEIDGDHILYIFAKYMKEENTLTGNNVVTTVMANMGLYNALEEIGINTTKTKVGDRYVLEDMLKNNYNIGGEQSGHVIMLDYNTCGDGMLVALQLTSLIRKSGKKLSELSKGLVKYPQKLGKVVVNDKQVIMNDNELINMINLSNEELGKNGRVLIRPSGTEPVIRVMVEAITDELCDKYYDILYKKVNSLT